MTEVAYHYGCRLCKALMSYIQMCGHQWARKQRRWSAEKCLNSTRRDITPLRATCVLLGRPAVH